MSRDLSRQRGGAPMASVRTTTADGWQVTFGPSPAGSKEPFRLELRDLRTGRVVRPNALAFANMPPALSAQLLRAQALGRSNAEQAQLYLRYWVNALQSSQPNRIRLRRDPNSAAVALVLGCPGLPGGGRTDGYVLSGVLLAGAGAVTLFTGGAGLPAMLAVGGFSGGAAGAAGYTYGTTDEQYDEGELFKKTGLAALGGVAAAPFQAAKNAALLTKVVVGAAGSATGGVVTTTVEAATKGKVPEFKQLATSAALGGLGGAAGAGFKEAGKAVAGQWMGRAVGSAIEETADDAAGLLACTAINSAEGAATSAGTQVVTNVAQRKKWHEGVGEAAATGAILSGTLSAAQKQYRMDQKQAAVDLARQQQLADDALREARAQDEQTQEQLDIEAGDLESSKAQEEVAQATAKEAAGDVNQAQADVEQARTQLEGAQAQAGKAKAEAAQAQTDLTKAEAAARPLVDRAEGYVDARLKENMHGHVDGHRVKDRNALVEAVLAGKDVAFSGKRKRLIGIKLPRDKASIKLTSQEAQQVAQARKQAAAARSKMAAAQQQQGAADAQARAAQNELAQAQQRRNEAQAAQAQASERANAAQERYRVAEQRRQAARRHRQQAEDERVEVGRRLEEARDDQPPEDQLVGGQAVRLPDDPGVVAAVDALAAALADGDNNVGAADAGAAGAVDPAANPAPAAEAQDYSWEELHRHVVLVHTLEHDTTYVHGMNERVSEWVYGHLGIDPNTFDWTDFYGRPDAYVDLRAKMALLGVLREDGTIGHHLDFDAREYQGALETRPSVHWTFNQLVQPNAGGNWEDGRIALLEPATAFENTESEKLFAIAPYDGETFGPHRFSEHATLLVPDNMEDLARAVYTPPNFRGTIRTYPHNESLRQHVHRTLEQHYPDVWHMCDPAGQLTGNRVRRTNGGYPAMTCIKTATGQVLRLIRGQGRHQRDRLSEAMREPGRFVGLHMQAAHYAVEDGNHPYFPALKRCMNNLELVRDDPLFAAHVAQGLQTLAQLNTELAELGEDEQAEAEAQHAQQRVEAIRRIRTTGVLTCLDIHNELLSYDPRTGTAQVAAYLINQAIYADLASLFYHAHPDAEGALPLSPLDLKMLIQGCRPFLINLLDNISEADDDLVLELAGHYVALLSANLAAMEEARAAAMAQVEAAAAQPWDEPLDRVPCHEARLLLDVAPDQWRDVAVPNHDALDFELGQGWPHAPALRLYIQSVVRVLPRSVEHLLTLHRQLGVLETRELAGRELHELDEGTRRGIYQLRVVASLVSRVLQEHHFQGRSQESGQAVFVNRLGPANCPLARFGLYELDHTEVLGDCLFDNIGAQLQPMVRAGALRQALVAYLEAEREQFEMLPDYDEGALLMGAGREAVLFDSWESYLAAVAVPTVWGTELMARAVADMLDRPLLILTDREDGGEGGVDGAAAAAGATGVVPLIYNADAPGKPILLRNHGNCHFTSCAPRKGLSLEAVMPMLRARAEG